MDSAGILDAAVAHAMTSGLFERVNGAEPKAAPGTGLTCAVWVQGIGPIRASGLAVTSALLVLNVRLYTSMIREPQDAIDPSLLAATDTLMNAYTGAFTLAGLVRHVDLLGAYGAPLSAQAGYLNQDSKLFRVFTITLPLVVNDAWTQGA